jgi:hypothetical protein
MLKQWVCIGVLGTISAFAACNDVSGTCATLTTCCPQLTGDNGSICKTLVAQGDDNSCGEAQADFEADDMCVVTSTSTPTTTSVGTGCAGLTACCNMVPSAEQIICQTEVTDSAGSDDTCTTDLESWSAYCTVSSGTSPGGGVGTGCAGLTACCADLTGSDQTLCQEEVSDAAGNETTCAGDLTLFQDEGYCGSSPGSGSGITISLDAGTTSTGTGCAGLSSCCATLSGASQTECTEEVTDADGVDTTCDADLEVWHDAGMCGGSTGTAPVADAGAGTSSGSCATLSSCQEEACEEEVSEGLESACDEYLTDLQAAGSCGS